MTVSVYGILLRGEGIDVRGSAISRELKPISRSDLAPFMISGTTVNAGQDTILVLAVGVCSIAEKSEKSACAVDNSKRSLLSNNLDHVA